MATHDAPAGRIRPKLQWALADDDHSHETVPATDASVVSPPAYAAGAPMQHRPPPHHRPQMDAPPVRGPRPTLNLAPTPPARPAATSEPAAPAWQPVGTPGQELMLLPGQMHFGARVSGLRTLLGSCVAITLWHPQRRMGGMCHFLLPNRQRAAGQALDGRFGDEAVEAMLAAIRKSGAQPADFHAHLYGGADTMPESSGVKFNVGERNIEEGWRLIDHHGFQLQGVDVGEDVPRTVSLTLATGEVQMRRGQSHAPASAALSTPPPSSKKPR